MSSPTVHAWSPTVAEPKLGGPSHGVEIDDWNQALFPAAFLARTRTWYSAPLSRP